jgi:hypothetical protein
MPCHSVLFVYVFSLPGTMSSGYMKARAMSSVKESTRDGEGERMERRTRYLLSNDIDVMAGLNLEVAVVGPEIN